MSADPSTSQPPNSPAKPGFPSAGDSDPRLLGWMQGAPPPADRLVRKDDNSHFAFPRTRWSFANMRQLLPTTGIWRGEGPPSALPAAAHIERLQREIDDLAFTPLNAAAGARMNWAESLQANYTDAICVLHRGRRVYERYLGVMTPHGLHMSMSVTKSYTGLLAQWLVHDGALDETKRVPHYVPELGAGSGGAWAEATVRDVMDMRIGVAYSEDYADPAAHIWEHARAGGLFPRPPGDDGATSFYRYLVKLRQEGPHGAGFYYKTVNSDVLGWVIRRVTGQTFGEHLSERLWQPLACEQDAAMLVDAEGTEFAGGGLNPCLRDMARLGEALRCAGALAGRQVVPEAVVQDICRQGSAEAFKSGGPPTLPGGAYRNMWWVTNNEHGAYAARGVHGQAIYIDPAAEMVIARFGSHPLAANVHFDPTSLPAFDALACHLGGG
ncbi:MAG: serine hydrolase [Rubrivivax sp.]|nr:serine hydrolase [Rubrivivax sp.]